ncbi:MAG: hypothetical protein ACRDY3_09500 [Acidimicrobiales bacterium]
MDYPQPVLAGGDGPVPADGGRRADVIWAAAAFSVYSFLAVGVLWHIWTGHPTTETIGGGDSYMDSWFLAYAAQAVVHGHDPFFTTLGNHPFGINVLDQSSQLLLGVVGLPVTVAFGALATFNLWITAGMALGALSAYALARRFVAWHPAAVLAGLVYGFSPYMIVESADGHLNIAFAALPPLVLLVLHDTLVARPDRWVRNGILLAVLAVAQFFVSDEVLVTTVIVAAIAVVASAVVGHRAWHTTAGAAARALALAGVATAAALAYPVWSALRGPGHIVGPIQPVAEAYRADLLGPFLPDQMEKLAPGRLVQIAQHFASTPGENGSYLGIPLLLLVAVGVVWLWRERAVLVVAVTGAAAFVLSLGGALAVKGAPPIGPGGAATGGIPLPEALAYKLPPLRNLVPVRISLYVALAAGILLAVVLDRLVHRHRHRLVQRLVHRRRGAAWKGRAIGAGVLALGLAVLVPLVPEAPFVTAAPAGIPPYFTGTAYHRIPAGSVALLYPYPSEAFPAAEAWQGYAGLPFAMPGGYFLVPGATGAVAFSPTLSYSRATPLALALTDLWAGKPLPETAARRSALRRELAADGVRTVVAVPQDGTDPAAALATLEWLLGPPSAGQGGTVDWYGLRWPPAGPAGPAGLAASR